MDIVENNGINEKIMEQLMVINSHHYWLSLNQAKKTKVSFLNQTSCQEQEEQHQRNTST